VPIVRRELVGVHTVPMVYACVLIDLRDARLDDWHWHDDDGNMDDDLLVGYSTFY
jgi:hypothetical protein